ncbi:MAG TPA: methyltransferase domain-containing protein [Clostridiales bacterium]|nr:methyltransferase domain-containing protein [Clostridiales bacterium]
MKKLDIIRTYYEANMAKDLPEYGILGWESEEAQRLRFDMLLSAVDLEGMELLDVGCGTGNLLEHIISKGINVEYTGVDLLDKMIDRAKSKGLAGEFIHADIFEDRIFENESFDVIYTSGIFNLDLGSNIDFLKRAIGLFLDLSRQYVVFNLLHRDSPDREDKYFYTSPDEVGELLEEYSDRIENVQFIEAYLKNDFTVVIRKKREAD